MNTQKNIFHATSTNNGQPMFFVKAILRKESLECYSGLKGDYYEFWEWEVFPVKKSDYQQTTQIEEKLNPEADYPVNKKLAKLILVCSTIEYLAKQADRSVFLDKTIAHHN